MGVIDEIQKAEVTKRRALAQLHQELGYPSAQALAQAILDAAGSSIRLDMRGASSLHGPRHGDVPRRNRLTPEKRQAIIDALKSGTTGTEVTREFGISYPTVHEIKRSLGLVTPRPRPGARRNTRKKKKKRPAKE